MGGFFIDTVMKVAVGGDVDGVLVVSVGDCMLPIIDTRLFKPSETLLESEFCAAIMFWFLF